MLYYHFLGHIQISKPQLTCFLTYCYLIIRASVSFSALFQFSEIFDSFIFNFFLNGEN